MTITTKAMCVAIGTAFWSYVLANTFGVMGVVVALLTLVYLYLTEA